METSADNQKFSPDARIRRQQEIEQARRDLQKACLEIAEAKKAEELSKPAQPMPRAQAVSATATNPVKNDVESLNETLDSTRNIPLDNDSLISDEEMEALLDDSDEGMDVSGVDIEEEAEDELIETEIPLEERVLIAAQRATPRADDYPVSQEPRLSLAEQIRAAGAQVEKPKRQPPPVKVENIPAEIIPQSVHNVAQINTTSGINIAPKKEPKGQTTLAAADALLKKANKVVADTTDDLMEAIVMADITAYIKGG